MRGMRSVLTVLVSVFVASVAHGQPPVGSEFFVDFDAPVDGDGSAASPWNHMVGRGRFIAEVDSVTVWMSGFGDPSERSPNLRISPREGGAAELRVMSRHLVDPTAEPAELSQSFRLSEWPVVSLGNGVFQYELPMPDDAEPHAMIRGWDLYRFGIQPIPRDGLPNGVAMRPDLVESYRLDEPRLVVREAPSVSGLFVSPAPMWSRGATNSFVVIRTASGSPAGVGFEPEWQLAVHRDEESALLTMNDFGGNDADRAEVAGITFSMLFEKPGGTRSRTIQFNPAKSAVVRDCLFAHCTAEDNIAAVNGGGDGTLIEIARNQYLGTGVDGGPVVASTQSTTIYDRMRVHDLVVHAGMRMLYTDGEPAGLEAGRPAGLFGTFHSRKVAEGESFRNVAVHYSDVHRPFQFSTAIPDGADVREPSTLPVQVWDVYLTNGREMWDFAMNGVSLARSYLHFFNALGLSRVHGTSSWESNVIEMQNAGSNALGILRNRDVAFRNNLFRVDGHPEAGMFGIEEEASGQIFLADNVFALGPISNDFLFSVTGLSRSPNVPLLPGAVAGWSDDADLGPFAIDDRAMSGPTTLTTPELGGAAESREQFNTIYGGSVSFETLGVESLPLGQGPVSASASLDVSMSSEWVTGPIGIDGRAFSGNIGPFQDGAPALVAGLVASPFDRTDAFDLAVFGNAFLMGDLGADAHPPYGGDGRIERIDHDEFLKRFGEE
ncbi:MAG: hypothetical protein AAGI30_01470 [Planctomycetota bacterium]